MAAIAVGMPCIDRGTSTPDKCVVNIDGTADGTGDIDTCQVFPKVELTALEFASFFVAVGPDTISTNGNTDGSNLTAAAGDCRTFTAAGNDFTAFAINSGEYIGCQGTGNVERDGSGFNDIWIKTETIPVAAVEFNRNADDAVSVRATGLTGNGGLSIPAAMHSYRQRRVG